MRKIRLIATGGTIACLPSEKGLVPGLNAEALLKLVDIDPGGVSCQDLFSMDSSNIQPEEWLQIAAAADAALRDGANAIVLTHGTDTMAYTASMLSFLLQNIPIPLILTGAQYPMVYPDSDGRRNLGKAIIAARTMPGGVYVCFGNAIIRGCRAVKTRTTSLNAFESINAPYVATVVDGRYIPIAETHPAAMYRYYDTLNADVALIKLAPGTNPQLIENCPACGIQGVVVEAFGLGGVHNVRRDHAEAIRHIVEQGLPVVLASQCLYEPSSMNVYEVAAPLRKAGVISALDMTTEAAVTKLMWILGQTRDMEAVRSMMQTDYCGEIGAEEPAAP